MLVRYKGHGKKPNGMPVILPVGIKSQGAAKRHGRVVYLNPVADLPEDDALKLVAADPYNFELVDDVAPPVRVESTQVTEHVEPLVYDVRPEPPAAIEEIAREEHAAKAKKKSGKKKAGG